MRQYRMCIAAAPDYVDFAIKLSPSLGYHFTLCSYHDAYTGNLGVPNVLEKMIAGIRTAHEIFV